MTPLPLGKLREVVESSLIKAGIEHWEPNTPADLFLRVADWDGLLSTEELKALTMIVKELSPIRIEGMQ